MYFDTFIRFIKRFFSDLFHSVLFAIREYDDRLQYEKTPRQRVLFWLVVGIVTIGILFLISYVLINGLQALNIIDEGFMN
ncbi:hypothetical protein KC726_05955 [Candidatus Woesebacteria bacterium]|nr:hypothetical protein [Candidatus Woesebacteria bacterium]